jgi:hypothetical protein
MTQGFTRNVVSITGDAGGTLSSVSFIISGGTTGLTFAGAGTTETLTGTLIVANGGTGIATTTAYAPICGGTTPTGVFQAADTGIAVAGTVFTSNGNAALPTWQAGGGGGGLTYSEITGASKTIVVNEAYGANRGGGVAFTLPAAAAIGKEFQLLGIAGLWSIVQPANTYIRLGNLVTTVGAGGSLTATSVGDVITCRCIVADLGWIVESCVGNIAIV